MEESFDKTWIDGFAGRVGSEPLAAETVAALLALAGDAARESGDRRNAPISCFLAGLVIGRDGQVPSTLAVERIVGRVSGEEPSM